MSESYVFDEPDYFTVGTVGPKGQRVFYVQCRQSGQIVSLKLEKLQVDALAKYLDNMLDDVAAPEPALFTPAGELLEPINPVWAVGSIGVAYDTSRGRIVVVAQRVPITEDEADDPEDERPTARFDLSPTQVRSFVNRATEAVAAGRPLCPYCGRPLDPQAGLCPCYN